MSEFQKIFSLKFSHTKKKNKTYNHCNCNTDCSDNWTSIAAFKRLNTVLDHSRSSKKNETWTLAIQCFTTDWLSFYLTKSLFKRSIWKHTPLNLEYVRTRILSTVILFAFCMYVVYMYVCCLCVYMLLTTIRQALTSIHSAGVYQNWLCVYNWLHREFKCWKAYHVMCIRLCRLDCIVVRLVNRVAI